jgi:CRP-like cAMP-binding protein
MNRHQPDQLGTVTRHAPWRGPQRLESTPHPAQRTHRTQVVASQPSPLQNHLLETLTTVAASEYERLLSKLERVRMPLGWTVNGPGERQKYLYFLTEGLVSRCYVTRNGEKAEFALAGVEGAIGVASFLGGRSMPSQAVVVSAGYAYRVNADVVEKACEQSAPLLQLLLRYTMLVITQTGQAAVCSRHHSVIERLSTLILSMRDRLPSNELKFTQESFANALGVRRESVTEAAGKLQAAGLIRCTRGKTLVLDRAKLEARACECYGVVRDEQERLFPGHSDAHANP